MSREYEECDGRWLFASPIEEGSGVIHVNRFRLYFYVQSLAEIDLLAARLFDRFQDFMSSYFTNLAHVNRHKGKKGGDFFQFVLNDPKGFFMDDWVKVVRPEVKQGFSVETQRYVEPWTLFPFREHFLDGRRSWIVGRANPENTRTDLPVSLAQSAAQAVMTEQTHVYNVKYRCFVETAAVERFASLLMRGAVLADPVNVAKAIISPALIQTVREQVKTIWVTMLNHFASTYSLEIFSPPDPFRTGPSTELKQGVFLQAMEHKNASDLLADPCVMEILGLHPGLASQRYTAI